MTIVECATYADTLAAVTQNIAIGVIGWAFFRYIFGTKR